MRKVIALSGEPKVGKTEAIRLCFQRLLREIATDWAGIRFAHPKEGVDIEQAAAKKARTYRGCNDRCTKDLSAHVLAYCGR